jgi:hypothetical protein
MALELRRNITIESLNRLKDYMAEANMREAA